jgi:rubredoxin-NAD+ reductase
MPVAVKTPAAPLTVLPAPLDVDVNWETEELEDGMLAKLQMLRGHYVALYCLGQQQRNNV